MGGDQALSEFLELVLQIPGAEFSSTVGLWNPVRAVSLRYPMQNHSFHSLTCLLCNVPPSQENPLIAGLWVGCFFDLIIMQSSFILMLLQWCVDTLGCGVLCLESAVGTSFSTLVVTIQAWILEGGWCALQTLTD